MFTGRWRVWHMELTFVCVCVRERARWGNEDGQELVGGEIAGERYSHPRLPGPIAFLEDTDLASDPGSSIPKKRMPEGPDRPQKGAVQGCQALLTSPPGT